MADLTLSVRVGAGSLELQNPPPSPIVSPSVYSRVVGIGFGDTVWVRSTVKSDYVHGVIQYAAVKDEPKIMLALRLYGANVADIWSYCSSTLLPPFEVDDYNIQFSINGAVSTFECGPADHKLGGSGAKGDLDPHQFRAAMQEIVLTIPRSPIAVTGPKF